MSGPPTNRRGALLAAHLCALAAVLGLWTWKLLDPTPVPDGLLDRFGPGARFAAAKGLHLGGYCALALLAVTLPVRGYWRWFLVGLLALHGVATEIGQTFVPGRTGSVRDVLIDWAGIALGVLVWRACKKG